MKNLLLPIIRKAFVPAIGKTVIECSNGNTTVAVFVNGDKSEDASLLCNVTQHEVGDTFVARKDSANTGANNQPLYLAGETVARQKMSYEFKSLSGNNTATQFAQGASAFGLNLIVQMGA